MNRLFSLVSVHRQRIGLALILLATALLVGQHWGMRLSNSDDPWITRLGIQGSLDVARAQGRFWLFPINLMAQLPYLAGSWEMANTIKMGVNALVLLSFVQFCAKLAGRSVGLLAGAVWLALIDVSPGYYSPFHGFLLMFNLQFFALFLSFTLYLKSLEQPQSDKPTVVPYLLFGFSLLAYEPMLFYAGVYPLLYWFKSGDAVHVNSARSLYQMACKFLAKNYCLVIAVAAYFGLYFGFRAWIDNPGRGIDAGGEPIEIVKTIYRFSVNGFHIQLKPLISYFPTTSVWSLSAALAYGALLALAFFLLIPRTDEPTSQSPSAGKIVAAAIAFYVFCPNFLHGFVASYREWAASDPHYVGNYFSSFPLAMGVAWGILYLVGGEKARAEKVLFWMVLYVLFSSACDNYMRWANLAQANRTDSQLWQRAIVELKEAKLPSAAKSVLVCASSAPEHVSGDDRYWTEMLSRYLGRTVVYNSKSISKQGCDVKLDFQALRVGSQAIAP